MNRVLLSLAIGTTLMAQAPAKPEAKAAPAPKLTDGQAIDQTYAFVEMQFVPAADAMPEDKYGFAPKDGEFKGVKTFAQQVKHVAAVNYFMGAQILGEKLPAEAGKVDMSNLEMGPDNVNTKAEIMAYLKASFAYARKAINSITDKNATHSMKSPFGNGTMTPLGISTLLAFHGMDHYGQMVVYLRLNGIIPPASRQQHH